MEQYNETDPLIMQLLETKSFGQLDASEKQLVLRQYTESEYDDLYQTLTLVGRHVKNDTQTSKEKVRSKLLEEFDSLYPDKPAGKLFVWRNILRYAAVILLFAGVSWLFLKPGKPDNNALVANIKDTVFIETVKLMPHLIRDTIFLNNSPAEKSVKQSNYFASLPHSATLYSDNTILTDVNIVDVYERNSVANEIKGGSILDDSLIASIGFLTY